MALVAVPSHRIQTIHGAFGSPSFASMLPVGSHAQASSFNSLPNVSFSSCRGGRGANLSILAARTAAASAPPTPIVTRPRRPSIRQVPITTRRAAPPPPRTAVASAQDPFADSQHVEVASEPTRASSRPVMVTYTYSSYHYPAASPVQRDDQRTSKLVASVLLNRASGKPLRRKLPSYGEQRPYVKSCLSKVVEVEC